MQSIAYAPSLGLVVKKKGTHTKQSEACQLWAKPKKKSEDSPEEFNMGKWIADLSEWLLSNGGSRSRAEILQRIEDEGMTLASFHSRVSPYQWLQWEGKGSLLKILSEEEIKKSSFNDSFQERASQLFQHKPRALGDWVPVESLKEGDWIWIYYPFNLHTDYAEVIEDGIPPMGPKFKAAIVDDHVFKRTSKRRTK